MKLLFDGSIYACDSQKLDCEVQDLDHVIYLFDGSMKFFTAEFDISTLTKFTIENVIQTLNVLLVAFIILRTKLNRDVTRYSFVN